MEKKDDNQAQAGMTGAEAAKELYRMLERLLMAAKTANEMNPVKISQGLIRDVEDKAKIIGYMRLLRRIIRRNGLDSEKGRREIECYRSHLTDLLPRVDSLTF